MTEKATPLPQSGGSFTRDAKGILKQAVKPTAPRSPRKAKPSPTNKEA